MNQIYLFDMDGVLLTPNGYHTSLRASVKRIGRALGAPNADLSPEAIAKLEALSVTNEWDSLAIAAALTLLHVWKYDPTIQLNGLTPHPAQIVGTSPDFEGFLETFTDVGDLPGHSAYQKILKEVTWLTEDQQQHIRNVLHESRNLSRSLTQPAYQETVLGSRTYQEHYRLEPQLDLESYLIKYDQPVMTEKQYAKFQNWLNDPEHAAGILTNRPSRTPSDYLSSPEAELGAQLIGMDHLPMLGSGLLAWYAVTRRSLPDYVYFKPNPVHSLGLLQMTQGQSAEAALSKAADLESGQGIRSDWGWLEGSHIVIFEDAAKGLQSGQAARDLLAGLGVQIQLILIGVTTNPTKREALTDFADFIVSDINQIDWDLVGEIKP